MGQALALYLSAQAAPPPGGGAVKSDSKVKLTLSAAKPDADGKQVVKVTLTIDDGWHVYANPVGLQEFASVQTTITVGATVKPKEVRVAYPKGELIKDAVVGDYHVYKEKVEIPVTVIRARGDTGPLEVSVKFQPCCHIKGKETCLPRAELKQRVP
jgi:DsbC/DsbD-like thiol-disulfide interchange protein